MSNFVITNYISLFLNSGYETPVPSDYDDLPQLKGRATVEMVVKKADGENFTNDEQQIDWDQKESPVKNIERET